jgi:hypothetical protein
MGERHYSDKGMIMLGTYGTNFLICNLYVFFLPRLQLPPTFFDILNSLIHTYFVVKQLLDALQPGSSYPMSCPQCQNVSFSVGSLKLSYKLRQGYAPLLDREGEPMVSVEDARTSEGEAMV